MLLKRIYQFFLVYLLGVTALWALKWGLSLSDYVVPGLRDVWFTAGRVGLEYLRATCDTLLVAVIGHFLSILLALVVGVIAQLTSWIGALIRAAAFNIQAYPIVAVAPIIFILLGDGLSSRLIIAAMICYFPLLLAFIGVLSTPVQDIEHFYVSTGRDSWMLRVKIRTFENLKKLITVIAGSATLAMVGTIVAEFIAAGAGIGYRIRIALYQSDMAKILIALLLIGVFTSLYLGCLEWLGVLLQNHWAPEAPEPTS